MHLRCIHAGWVWAQFINVMSLLLSLHMIWLPFVCAHFRSSDVICAIWCLYSLAWRKILNTNIAYLLLSLKILEPVQIQPSRSIVEKSWKHLRWNHILLNIGLQCCGVYQIFLNRYFKEHSERLVLLLSVYSIKNWRDARVQSNNIY